MGVDITFLMVCVNVHSVVREHINRIPVIGIGNHVWIVAVARGQEQQVPCAHVVHLDIIQQEHKPLGVKFAQMANTRARNVNKIAPIAERASMRLTSLF